MSVILGRDKATILEIQRMSTEDGPGIRTTVFFKGCSLKCAWCHNPESISMTPQLHWIGNRCIGCRSCLDVCPNGALTLTEQGNIIDRSLCDGCGTCAEGCPSTALEMLGKKWELDELVHEVIKDKAYFDKSDGGITISGGEPALQPQFAAAFLKALKEKGVQTAFDTCGLCPQKSLEMILPYATMVLFDLKQIDSFKHSQLTGAENEKILNNLIFVSNFIKSHVHPKTLWIRTPIIPGATDNIENIQGIGEYIVSSIGQVVDRWELCAFNNLCKDKYLRLGLSWEFQDTELIKQEKMEQLAEAARKTGVNPDIVHWSGSTRLEEGQDKTKNEVGNAPVKATQNLCSGP
ncbi:glycyl-radical enzyme activating protein [Thermodesulfobacteriota bacterium]